MRLAPIALAALAALTACSNTAPEPDANPEPTPHVFDRPAAVPEWAGDLMEDPEDLVIFALDPTPISGLLDWSIRGKGGQVLPELLELIRAP